MTDPANSTGKMQAGSVAISLEDNEGLSGSVPLQVGFNFFCLFNERNCFF